MTTYIYTSSEFQTKEWRQKQEWYKNGKRNECEKEQLKTLQNIIGIGLLKTNIRLNKLTYEMSDKKITQKDLYFFMFSENFDAIFEHNGIKYFVNLKFICDQGGAQNRTSSLVYDFIKCQLEYLQKNNENCNVFFINILDGDCSFYYKNHYDELVKQYNNSNNIFVGDTLSFSKFWPSMSL